MHDEKPPPKTSTRNTSLLPSARDVARLAGVSQSAVSRALNPHAYLSQTKRARVLNAMQELGYRPNLLARSLNTGKSGIVGVVLGNPRDPFLLEAFTALSERLSQASLHLLVFTARAESTTDHLVEALLRFRIDALLLMSATVSSELAEQCRALGIRVIYFNCRPQLADSFASITSSNSAGAASIAKHLVEQGYKRLAYVGGFEHSSLSYEREISFVSAVIAHGLPTPEKAYGHFDRAGAVAAARHLLSLDPRPDAIFCANDVMALATIEVARDEFNLKAGQDLGVAGFDDIEGAHWGTYDLTTYAQPIEKMIDKVTEIVVFPDLFPDRFPDDLQIVVIGELRIRGSTHRSPDQQRQR